MAYGCAGSSPAFRTKQLLESGLIIYINDRPLLPPCINYGMALLYVGAANIMVMMAVSRRSSQFELKL